MDVEKLIRETVHYEYYANDTNCATTTLICLGKLFGFEPEEQLISAAADMHGAGGYRAQCGKELLKSIENHVRHFCIVYMR